MHVPGRARNRVAAIIAVRGGCRSRRSRPCMAFPLSCMYSRSLMHKRDTGIPGLRRPSTHTAGSSGIANVSPSLAIPCPSSRNERRHFSPGRIWKFHMHQLHRPGGGRARQGGGGQETCFSRGIMQFFFLPARRIPRSFAQLRGTIISLTRFARMYEWINLLNRSRESSWKSRRRGTMEIER